MKKIINGRLFDTENMVEVASRSFDEVDPNLGPGALVSYREYLYREVTLRPGETVDTACVKGSYSCCWLDEKIDKRKGVFVLMRCRGRLGEQQTLQPVSDDVARAWFEKHHGDEYEKYVEFFGEPETQFRGSTATAAVQALESKLRSQKRDIEAKDEAIKAKDAELESLKMKLNAMGAVL